MYIRGDDGIILADVNPHIKSFMLWGIFMKSVKKILMGIAVILFGLSIVIGGLGGTGAFTFIYIGWLVSIIGLIMSFVGYYFTEDDTD